MIRTFLPVNLSFLEQIWAKFVGQYFASLWWHHRVCSTSQNPKWKVYIYLWPGENYFFLGINYKLLSQPENFWVI